MTKPPPSEKSENQVSLTSITAVEVQKAPDKADNKTEIEKVSIERDRAQVELASLKQDVEERKKYAHRIFCLISVWLLDVFFILVLDGLGGFGWRFIGVGWTSFSLPPAIILALIGSTTVNVLGIFYIVTHYLFPKR